MDQAARRIEHRFEQTERRVNRSFDNMATAGITAFASLSAGRAVGRVGSDLIRISDAYQQLTNQINSASTAVGHNIATIEEISDVALSSRASLQGTTMLYTRLERSAADLNLTQQETLRITQLVGMSFAASGATIQEQRSSILQLSQALQSGILQGDELRSLREGAPEIARAIATEMGVGIGALKELGSQGLITSEVVMRSILNAGTTIQGQFNATEMTVSQAIENMRTRFTLYAAGVNEATNATRTLTSFIDYVSLNFDALAEATVVAASVVGGTLAASALPALTRAALAAATSINVASSSTTILVGVTGTATVANTALVRSMVALRGAMGFLMTTPWGAAILAIGAAVGYLALETQSAASRADRLSRALGILGQETDQYGQATERATAAQNALTEVNRVTNMEAVRATLVEQRRELRRLENEYRNLQDAINQGASFIVGPSGERIKVEMDATQLSAARARLRELGEEVRKTENSVNVLDEGYAAFSSTVREHSRITREAADVTAILTASNEGLDKVLKTVVDTMGDVGGAQQLLNDLERASAIDDATEALGRQTTALAQLEAGIQAVRVEAMAGATVSFADELLGDPSVDNSLSASAQSEIDALEAQAVRARGIIEILQTFIDTLNNGTNLGAESDARREREQQLRRQATIIRETIQLQREFSRELEITSAQFRKGETEAYTRQLEALTQAQTEASDGLAVLEAQRAAGTITDALYREGMEQLAATTAVLRDQREQLAAVADAFQDVKLIEEQINAQEQLDALYESQISHEIQLARLLGNEERVRGLERELQIRERIAELAGAGISKEAAQEQATQEADQMFAARQYNDQRDLFSQAFSEGIRAAMNGDLSGFLSNQFGNLADISFRRLGEQLFDNLFSAPADVVKATAEGAAQGAAAAAPMTAAMTAGGVTAGATINTAITTAGGIAAQMIASAVASAGSTSGKGNILSSIFSSAIGGGKFPGKAIGGPVRAGQPYIVGEHKPELFIPDQAGRIVPQLPSGAASAMITYSPTYAIDARGSTPDAIAALRREMLATRQADMQQFGTRVRGVLPGALASAQRDGAV
jgi:tape measure domain-containing protein